MVSLPLTSLFVAAFALALVALSFPVTLRRIKVGVPYGDGPDDILRRLIRAQGNFAEYVPLGLIALALVEGSGASTQVVLTLGGLLAAGRLAHAAGMLGGWTLFRVAGMVATYSSLIGSAFYLAVTHP